MNYGGNTYCLQFRQERLERMVVSRSIPGSEDLLGQLLVHLV